MSTMVMSACWPIQMPPTPKAVLISLADNANDHGVAWPSIPTIAERTCFSERAVHRAIVWLEDAGIVKADRSNGRHTKYLLTPQNYTQPPQMRHPRTSVTPADVAVEPPQMRQEPPQMRQSPLPEVRSNHQEPSLTVKSNRQAGASARRSRRQAMTFEQWEDSMPSGELLIPETDAVFEFADDAGIPGDLLALAWDWFCGTYGAGGARSTKTQANWRQVFRNAVAGNWAKVWYALPEGGYGITTVGETLRRAAAAKAQREAAA